MVNKKNGNFKHVFIKNYKTPLNKIRQFGWKELSKRSTTYSTMACHVCSLENACYLFY